ncbi:MAG TPA: molybdate ABC transporter substrate-binding protein [Casimicrobiaceae bacterium]|nr:molybdate ABC transporter substrate-binding protein [Casimicrobiaceae bacterium]
MRFLVAWLCLVLCGLARAQDVPNVAAAADLQFALDEIAAGFARETGRQVRITYGSSGNFRRQIAQGAPYELFLSADESYPLALAKEGRTRDRGVVYAVGRIALVAANDSPLVPDERFDGLRQALAAGRISRFAIANPEFAPYGRAAREALVHAGAWDSLQGKLVLGDNVAQAAQYVLTAAVQGGIISLAHARSAALAYRIRYALVPEDWHEPLRQRMVLMKNAGATATAFYDYLQQPGARAILTRYGFGILMP